MVQLMPHASPGIISNDVFSYKQPDNSFKSYTPESPRLQHGMCERVQTCGMACSVMDTELLLLREEAALLTIDISALLLASHSNSDTDFVSAFSSLLRLLGRGGPRRARDFLREVVPTCNKGSWVGLEVPMVNG